MPLTTVDIIILVCFIPALIDGLKKGVVVQACSLISLVLGVWLSVKFSSLLCDYLSKYLVEVSPQVLKTVSFILIFLVTCLFLGIIGRMIRGILKTASLGWIDKMLGIIFAIAKAALVLGLVILLFDYLNGLTHTVSAEKLSESKFYHPLKDLASYIFPYLKSFITKA